MTNHEAVSYHALRVTGQAPKNPSGDKLAQRDNQPFARTSAAHAISVLNMDYARQFYDPTGSGIMTEDESSLDDFFSGTPHSGIDFIKIDTDGADFDVLLGAERLIRESPTLGISIEVQCHGPVRSDANLFCNIDSLLRARGFSLFDIEVYRYSRSTLPKAFADNIPAQTREGQVLWGDALYLRDAGDPDYEDMWGISLPTEKLLKLAAIHEIYGLEDCAAEVLCKYRSRVDKVVDVGHCLNLLTPIFMGRRLTFEEYRRMFESEPRRWFADAQPERQAELPEREAPAPSSPVGAGREATSEEPWHDPENMQQEMAHLRFEVGRLRLEIERWQGYWRSVEGTAGWRLLAAWRGIRDRLAPEGSRRRRLYDVMVGPLRG
jgi:hypothetical protein